MWSPSTQEHFLDNIFLPQQGIMASQLHGTSAQAKKAKF